MIHNKAPHDVVILSEDGREVKRFKAGKGAVRLGAEVKKVGNIGRVPITKTTFKEAQGLPAYKEGIYYIVSQLVKSSLPLRKDLLVPAQILRDEKKRIIGCMSLGS